MNNFCLIGYPLGHSMSPIIHKELFKIKNIDASYNLNEIAPENLKIEYKKLKKLDGFNVTIHHKTGIIQMLDCLSKTARQRATTPTASDFFVRLKWQKSTLAARCFYAAAAAFQECLHLKAYLQALI